jgi:tRNA-specific adenosine deaminase 1
MCRHDNMLVDTIVLASITSYASTNFAPQPGKFTVFASFTLHDTSSGALKVVSMGTGSKCLPVTRLSPRGDALHDSHAEVLARRGLVRWLLEEVCRDRAGAASLWLVRTTSGAYALREGVRLHFYVSTVPCKITFASTRRQANPHSATTRL